MNTLFLRMVSVLFCLWVPSLFISAFLVYIIAGGEGKWWGGGPNFPGGKDLLGKALMEVRKILREGDAS